MPLKPEKILVFSSESDDSVGLQIYRLIYKEFNHDLIFLEGEYRSSKEIRDYTLPGEDGEDVLVNADELIQLFEEIEDTQVIEYPNIGMYYDYGELGFEFTEDMIEDIVSNIYPEEVRPEVRTQLEDFSYISQNWAILDWEASRERLLDNLDLVINSEEDIDKIEAVILESAEFQNATYPALFEMLLYMADWFEERHLFVTTNTKVFCLKTTADAEYQEFIYDIDEIDIEEDEDTKIIDLDVRLLNEWFDTFTMEPEDIAHLDDVEREQELDEEIRELEDEVFAYDEIEDEGPPEEESEQDEADEDLDEEDEPEEEGEPEEELDEPEEPEVEDEEPEEVEEEEDDLTAISGIGASTAETLMAEGYSTIKSIANATVAELTAIKGIGKATAQKYIDNAKKLI